MKISLDLLRRPPRPAPQRPDPARPALAPAHERTRGVRVDAGTRRLYQVLSLVLDYPTAELVDRVPALRSASAHGAAAENASLHGLSQLLDHLEATPLPLLQSDYVETFDLRRRCCLHLTYYAHGDTRRRGMALLDLKLAYQRAGVDVSDVELPDHLCVLLEFAACIDPPVGRVLLLDHRPGIELLRISLTERGSPYAGAVAALTCGFAPLAGDDREAVQALIAAGPPDEEVGMEAYSSGAVPVVATLVRP